MKGEDAMETDGRLDDRKVKILKAVIQNYLDTGEPVGSRTISKLTDLQLSSATIRNDNIVTDAAIRESISRIFKKVFFELCFFIVTPW